MICSNCGKGIRPGDAFCPACGTRVSGSPPGEEMETTWEAPGADEEKAKGAGAARIPPPVTTPSIKAPGTPPIIPAKTKKTSGLAVASLILGICAFTCLPFIGAILALIFGMIARGDIKRSGGEKSGSGMATAGIILGTLGLVLPLIVASVVIPVGYVHWWPKVEARRNLLKGVDSAHVYYLENGNAYTGLTADKLADNEAEVEFREAPGDEADVVYLDEATDQTVKLYCISRRGDKYTASARGDEWKYNFDITEPEKDKWWEDWDRWNPFD